MQYEDFDVSIEALSGRAYRVAVQSPAGEAQESVEFPFDTLALQLHLAKLKIALLESSGGRRLVLSQEEKYVLSFGKALFNFLMHGEIGRRYAVSYDRCQQEGKGLRLKLRIQDPALAALPWEFLYDQRFNHYLALSQRTPLLRYLELPRPLPPLRVAPPLRLLGMVANPRNLSPLKVAVEKERIEQAVAGLQAAGLLALTWLEGQGWRDLQRAMRRQQWHIFHFIGHGGFDQERDEGYLMFADAQGEAQRMSATSLARLLGDHDTLRVALLNACEGGQSGTDVFSSTAASLVRSGIPCVLAMQYAITDEAAIEFARTFYEALADGLPVDAAVAEARKAINLDNDRSLEWGTPVLFMRAKDGRIFDVQPTPGGQPTPTPGERPTTAKPNAPNKTPAAAGRGPAEKPTPRQPAPQPRPVLAAPPTSITIPHLAKGAAPLRMDWCWVPGGKFQMGGSDYDSEKPIHDAHVDGFWLARYPVTNAQYRLFMEAGGYDKQKLWTAEGWQARQKEKWTEPRYWGNAKWNGGQQPVVGVRWYEAVAFCAWAADTTGEKVRLPTEAEWEKGARGTDGRPFPWGKAEPDAKLCNFNGNIGQTTSVGQYSPQGDSPYGGADMSGNVREWCHSKYAAYPYQAGDGRNDENGTDVRVVRGGSWNVDRSILRCATRYRLTPLYRSLYVGFRCASTAF